MLLGLVELFYYRLLFCVGVVEIVIGSYVSAFGFFLMTEYKRFAVDYRPLRFLYPAGIGFVVLEQRFYLFLTHCDAFGFGKVFGN